MSKIYSTDINQKENKECTSYVEQGNSHYFANGISAKFALLNFAKGMTGPGILSMPMIFKRSGIIGGVLLGTFFGLLNCITMLQLSRGAHYLCKRNGISSLNYGNLAYEAYRNAFLLDKFTAKILRYVTNTALVLTQFGFLSTFLVFIGIHAQEVFEYIFIDFHMDLKYYLVTSYVFLILICLVRTVKFMNALSFIGNFMLIIAVILVFQDLTGKIKSPEAWFGELNGTILAAGSIMFSYGGQSLILPIGNKMKHPEKMQIVVSTGMFTVTLLSVALGVLGFLAYGSKAEGSITLNLPNNIIGVIVKISLMISVASCFAVQFYVLLDNTWPTIELVLFTKYEPSKKWNTLLNCIFRIILLTVVVLMAITIPRLEQIIPLFGITTSMTLGMLLPPIIDSLICIPRMLQKNKSKILLCLKLIFNAFLILIGMFCLVSGLYFTVMDIMSNE